MINLYKPNSKNSGAALSIKVANAENKEGKKLAYASGSVFLKIIKQDGWDDNKKRGYFKNNVENKDGNISVILNINEVCEILQCFKYGRAIYNAEIDYSDRKSESESAKKASFFHKTSKGSKSIRLYPKYENFKRGSFAFGVNDITNKNSIGIILESGEVRLIEEFLSAVVRKHFDQRIDADLVYFTKNQASGESKKTASTEKKQSRQEDENEDEFADTGSDNGSELEDDDDMPF